MIKAKLVTIAVALAIAAPLVAFSVKANACSDCKHNWSYYKHHRHGYYGAYSYGNYPHYPYSYGYYYGNPYSYGYYGEPYYRHCGAGLTGGALANHVVRNLHANPATRNQPICVKAKGHTVILKGTTLTAAQKQVALDITRNSCGVGLVIDKLYLQQP